MLNKTELVIQQADLARDMALLYQGKMCTPAHQKNMLDIIRGRLYISELIYAQGDHFLCSTSMAPPVAYIMPTADYKRTPDISIYYYRDTPFRLQNDVYATWKLRCRHQPIILQRSYVR